MTYIPGGGGGGSSRISSLTDVALNGVSNNHILAYDESVALWRNVPNATSSGVALPSVASLYVFQDNGNTIAVDQVGSTVSQLPTTPSNNVIVIQAAIDAAAGTKQFAGYAGGGVVQFIDGSYSVDSTLIVKYGVSLRGTARSFDRGRGTYNAAEFSCSGTVLKAAADGIRIISMGEATTAGVHSVTNPHGSEISNIIFDGSTATGATGVYMVDVTDIKLDCCVFVALDRGVDVDSSFSGAQGGTVATKIVYCDTFGCATGFYINASGEGGTDGEITGARVLNSTLYGINLNKGGWQITQSHFTTHSNAPHILGMGSPSILHGNYFDTAGTGPQIVQSARGANVTGNFFQMGNAALYCIDITASGGTKGVYSSNNVSCGGGGIGFIRLPAGSLNSFPLIAVGNSIFTNTSPAYVAPVLTNSLTAVVDQDTPNGPYVQGNRFFA